MRRKNEEPTLSDDPKQSEVPAAKALKQERATKAAQAMSEYIAERNAERAKTECLRALRLAKEAADTVTIDPALLIVPTALADGRGSSYEKPDAPTGPAAARAGGCVSACYEPQRAAERKAQEVPSREGHFI
jgi:hypothetical protein